MAAQPWGHNGMTTLWKRTLTLDELNALGRQSLVGHLGIVFTAIGEQHLEATMPVDERTRQPFGLLHGGASAVLAESMGSIAGYMATSPGENVVGIEINASHHRAASQGLVTAKCYPLHIGGRLQVWQTEIRNDKGKLCCTARLTVSVPG